MTAPTRALAVGRRIVGAEVRRLVSPRSLAALWGPLVLGSGAITLVVLTRGGIDERGSVGAARLAAPDGYLAGVHGAVDLLAVLVGLAFAGPVTRDLAGGTMRNLVLAEPRRRALLAGRFAATWAVVGAGTVLATTTAAATAAVAAGRFDLDTSAWTGFGGEVAGTAAAGWLATGLLGAVCLAAGVVLGPLALVLGVAWALALEQLVAAVADGVAPYLPVAVFGAVLERGTDDLPLSTAVAVGTAQALVALAAAAQAFARRDLLR